MKSIAVKLFCPLMVLAALLLSFPAASAAEPTFNGTGTETTVNETVSFSSRTVVTESYLTADSLHRYGTLAEYNDDCVPVAGSIVLGYYDLFDRTVIPNFNTGAYYNGSYIFLTQDTNVNGLIRDLYTRMNGGSGVSVDNFKTGLSSYLAASGHTASYTSVKSGSSINESLICSKLDANQPVVVFLTKYAFTQTGAYTLGSTSDSFSFRAASDRNHAVVAYGYQKIRYVVNGTTRTDVFLNVSFGTNELGLLRVSSTDSSAAVSGIYDAVAVSVS